MKIKNRTIFERDNIEILRGIDSESIDLIYLDPPFNNNQDYAAPIGSEAAGAAFKDTWTLSDVDDAWHGEIADREPALFSVIEAAELTHSKSMKSYLIMMAVRLIEMQRILKNNGSIYLHCSPMASHYLKTTMDSIFGSKTFRNELIWSFKRHTRADSNFYPEMHQVILFYTKNNKNTFNIPRIDKKDYEFYSYQKKGYLSTFNKGRKILLIYDYKKTKAANLDFLEYDQISHVKLQTPKINSCWTDIKILSNTAKENTTYPTQKPLALVERIIKASSNPGDIVLDPFCGCATTCIAAEKLGRKWIGIDISSKAVDLVKLRFKKDLGLDEQKGILGSIIHRTDIPERSQFEKVIDYGTDKHMLYGKQESLCNGCKIHFPFKNMTIDHKVPRAKGGGDGFENLQLLCNWCNSAKGTGTQEELIVKLKKEGML